MAGGECMCATCWSQPFCYDQVSGAFENFDGIECPAGFEPSVPASRVNHTFDRLRDLHCVPDEHELNVNLDDVVCPEEGGALNAASHTNPCDDVQPCARDADCPNPPPEELRCDEVNTGPRHVVCASNEEGLGHVRAMDELIGQCSTAHGTEVPSGSSPERFCFLSCVLEGVSCVPPADEGPCRFCDPGTMDPPGLSHDSILMPVDPDSQARVVVSVDGEGDEATTQIAGEMAINIEPECIGPIPEGEIRFCQATMPFFDLRAVDDLELLDTDIEDVHLINPEPLHDETTTIDGISLFVLPAGVRFYATADIEGSGLSQGLFESPGSLAGSIDWETRQFTAGTVIVDADQTSGLALALFATIPSLPPTADAGPDQVVACTDPEGTIAALSGGASGDPDGFDDITSFVWTSPVAGGTRTGSGVEYQATVPLGETPFVLMVTDSSGIADVDTLSVRVEDLGAPDLQSVELVTDCLWPPDHSMHLFRLGHEIQAMPADDCDPSPTVRIAGAWSNQPDDATGDGSTTADVSFGSAAVCVRAERSGNRRAPREYTVVLEATDSSGNSSQETLVVSVPHDQSPDERCETGGLAATVPDDDPACVADAPELAEDQPVMVSQAFEPEPARQGPGCSIAAPAVRPEPWLLAVGAILLCRRRR